MCLSLCVCVSACVCVCVSVCMCVHVWSVQVCECVWYLILFVIIHSCPSTLQSVNIFLTMFNKLVDQLEICEDKTLHAIKKFTTLFTGDVVHVMDHTRDDKAVVTLHFRTLGQLKHTQTQNATGLDTFWEIMRALKAGASATVHTAKLWPATPRTPVTPGTPRTLGTPITLGTPKTENT